MTATTALLEAADQFAQDLISNNIAGLMPVFTPVGIGQAMALQAQPDSAEGSESFEIEDQGDNLLHITFRGPESAGGDGTIFTQWVEVEGLWKVDAIGRVE
ncbi:MAG: hypothetical protein F4038_02350 [Chloroflexi bacterium]|nr:hypothetical protein [Chloroflexota bacterium]MYJ91881.1 hypothetical protein [Chloroflexota bacterium]